MAGARASGQFLVSSNLHNTGSLFERGVFEGKSREGGQ
jgi:hypothetical protein